MNKLMFPNAQTIKTYIGDVCVRGVEFAKTKIEFHAFLQNNIAALASEFFLTPEKEYRLPNFRDDHNGHIDVAWTFGAIPVVVIEIDSSFREKSVKKLLASNSNLLFWVYYGSSPFESFVKSIDITGKIKVIHFPARFGKFEIKPKIVTPVEISEAESKPTKSYSFADIRVKDSSAYEIWSSEQDAILKEYFRKDLAISEIAKKLHRKPGAIRTRIRKLGLR